MDIKGDIEIFEQHVNHEKTGGVVVSNRVYLENYESDFADKDGKKGHISIKKSGQFWIYRPVSITNYIFKKPFIKKYKEETQTW
jgi:hypothetical protein